jgi:nucleotide-binding universal stress UspA family protein
MRLTESHAVQTVSEKAVETDRILFSRILVATDFSAISRRALLYALSLGRRYESKIYLAHVIPERPLESSDSNVNGHRVAEQHMEEFTRAISGDADSCTVLIENGEGPLFLWVTIERLIHKHKIDLIVAGTHGLGARPAPFLGSGAEQIFRHATCPVLTIGPATETSDLPEIAFKNILYVTDFGPSAERARGYVVSVARKFEARVRFLHVVEDMAGSGPQELDHLRQIHIQRMKHSFLASHEDGIQADFYVRFGNVVDEILSTSREIHADLIVMGAKATGGWAGQVPLSTAYNVTAKASCPVLTVRA